MKRTEILTLMQTQVEHMTGLGEAVQVAVGATEYTADDVGALMTAADVATELAEKFKAANASAVGKEARIAGEYERGLRQWSFGTRCLADGLAQKSERLIALGKQNYNAGARAMAEAIQKLS